MKRTLRLAPALLFLVALAATSAPASAAPTEDRHAGVRGEFKAAYAAAARPSAVPPADGAALREHPLYPYLLAARLTPRIDDPAAGPEIQAFLERYGDQPVSRPLRREYLMTLALGKRWEAYLAAYRPEIDDTVAARCNAFAARIALGRTEGLEREVIEQWSQPKSLPPVCDTAFDWARDRGVLTTDLVERRAKAALDAGQAGLARHLARSLPESKVPFRSISVGDRSGARITLRSSISTSPVSRRPRTNSSQVPSGPTALDSAVPRIE